MPNVASPNWNETRRRAKLPGWESDEASRGMALQSLVELEDQENQRLNRKRQGGPFASGYTGAKDYRAGLNRQGRIADLTSRLSGQGGATVQSFRSRPPQEAEPMDSLRARARPGELARYEGPTDNLDFFARQALLENAQIQNQGLSEAVTEAGLAKLPGVQTERDRVARERMAELNKFQREQGVMGARAAGEAGVAKYGAEAPMRFDQDYEARAQARERGYYDPRVRQAEIEATTARTGAQRAEEASRRGERSAALKSLTDLLKQQSGLEPEIEEDVPGTGFKPFRWVGGDMEVGRDKRRVPNPAWAALEEGAETARGVLRGGQPSTGEKSLGMNEIEQFANENNISVDEALKLAEQHGYAVR
jgi:hypothetical protein